MAIKTPLAIDRTITLDINGSHQRIRQCAERAGLPPLLVVQAGPGLPVLHEVAKFQRLLNLERDFLVSYWEQRGCGAVPPHAADSVSLQQQVADLRAVLRWLADETTQRILILGISLGATIALQAVEQELDRAKAVIAISPDAHTASSDVAVYTFLQTQSLRPANRGLRRRVMKLGNPPYVNSRALQRRTVLLADLRTIERGKGFATLFREMLFGLIRTYGVVGAVRALRNLNLVQRRMMPEIVSLDLFANPPRVPIPVHYVFGEQDALTPPALAKQLPATIAHSASTVTVVPEAGHMVHFDHPDVVRSIAVNA
jgi:pimeloyl-ACP methyl ester carboxylesterase